MTYQQVEALATVVIVLLALFLMFPRRPRW